MTADEYLSLIKAAGIESPARFFQVDETTHRRWARGDAIPRSVQIVLVLLKKYDVYTADFADAPTMDAQAYRDAILKLGLTQSQTARLFMVNERTSRRWARNDQETNPPAAVAIALRIMIENDIDPNNPTEFVLD